jgi:hypothetical protein
MSFFPIHGRLNPKRGPCSVSLAYAQAVTAAKDFSANGE